LDNTPFEGHDPTGKKNYKISASATQRESMKQRHSAKLYLTTQVRKLDRKQERGGKKAKREKLR